MSTLETAEGVLGISDRGADRLEDEIDDVGTVGGGTDGAVAGTSGRSVWDVDEEDEARVHFVCCVRFFLVPCFTACVYRNVYDMCILSIISFVSA